MVIPEWTIRGTWVRDGWRGKEIGKLVLNNVLDDFNKENPDGKLWVNITAGAEGFYKKFGFRIAGYRTDTPEPMSVGLYSKDASWEDFDKKFEGNFEYEEV